MPEPTDAAKPGHPGESPAGATSRPAIWLTAVLLLAATFAAYHNSLDGPFVFDDGPAIPGNPSIRHLSALGDVLSPPREDGQTVGGRPLVNLSLAFNHALGGTAVRGYHLGNLAIHALGALTLFGVVRRTLLQPALRGRFGAAATPLAGAVALLWAVHPLQTESVTYVIQRAEAMVGLWYLLTLYTFIRGTTAGDGGRGWLLCSWTACLAGMATKEVMVSAPLIVLLFDRTFVTCTWRTAWAARRGYYIGLAATWLLLGWLVAGADHRGGTAGLGLGDSAWTYALTQTRSVTHYLRLAVWPHPLVFDYGTDALTHVTEAGPYLLVIGLLVTLLCLTWRRAPAAAFALIWCGALLAPSSSVVPIPVQPMAEHRMYLPLAAVVAAVVLATYARWPRACWLAFAGAAVALTAGTVARNRDYASATTLWAETVARRPANARAHCYLADALAAEGRWPEALIHYDEAIRLDRPALARGDRSIYGDILVNSGNVLRKLGRTDEAVQRYEEALRLDPRLAAAHLNLGTAHLQASRLPAAITHLTRALDLAPDLAAAHASLGGALLLSGRGDEALAHYERARRLEPSEKAERELGVALLLLKRFPEAVAHLEAAVRLGPDSAPAHEFLGNALLAQGRGVDAGGHFARAVQLDPNNARARRMLEALPRPAR